MAYELHIKRAGPITLADWRKAVASTPGLRMAKGTETICLGKETIEIEASEGDVDVYFPEEAAWHKIFRWSNSGVVFKTPSSFMLKKDARLVWSIAVALAQKLEAVIKGEEGELYELSSRFMSEQQ